MTGWNVEDIKKQIVAAHQAVEELPEPLKSQTFAQMVDKILQFAVK
jgi:hypothetical protein